MRVLVIGGTRFVGLQIVQELAAYGHEVTVWTRGLRKVRLPENTKMILGDRRNPAAARRVFARGFYDVVVDNIAYTAADVAMVAEYAGGCFGRYLLTSTAWVYAASQRNGEGLFVEEDLPVQLDEPAVSRASVQLTTLPALTREYVEGKCSAERATLTLDVPVTIVRPCMVSGPSDHNQRIGFYAQRLLDGGMVLLTDGGRACMQLLFDGDLARIMANLAQADRAPVGVYNVAPDSSVSVEALVRLIAEALHVQPAIVPASRGELRQRFPGYLASEPFAETVTGSYDASRLMRALPGCRWTALESWVRDTAQWVARHQPCAPETWLRVKEYEVATAISGLGARCS